MGLGHPYIVDKSRDKEGGATLIWVATMLVLLLGASAFAVDLGWIFLNGTRLQRAADAASLAGVINLPAFTSEARVDAEDATARNGFPIILNGQTTMTDSVLADNRYKVDLTTTIDTFFLRVLGFSQMDILKTATAEYIKPVRLGSPDNSFGDGTTDNFWAAINGQYTEKEQGEPYATQCITTPDDNGSARCSTGSDNLQYRPWGYYYVIEIGSGSSDLDVELYDPRHVINTTGGSLTSTGDFSWRDEWSQRWVDMTFRLLSPDTTPFDPFDNPEVCSENFGASNNASDGDFWTTLCSGSPTVPGNVTPGIWLLHIPSPTFEGSSMFGIRATVSSGPIPRVYGLFDMSIYVNINGNEAMPWLAEVRPEHEGKTFNLNIFDMGDNNGTAWFEILDPAGNVIDCSWTADNGQGPASLGTCHVDISNQRFNGSWLNLTIPLDGYTCDATQPLGCWWKIRIHNEGQAHDRTTWSASITGNPLRLVP
jgi:hypothetical protein